MRRAATPVSILELALTFEAQLFEQSGSITSTHKTAKGPDPIESPIGIAVVRCASNRIGITLQSVKT